MAPVKIGWVTCVHPFYDLPGVRQHQDAAVAAHPEAGCEVVAARIPEQPEDALEVAAGLKRGEVDLVLLFFCTWVAEDVTLALARETGDAPMLLWGLPCLDRDIPMPSPLSGLTATASNFRRLGKPFAHLIGPVGPESIQAVLRVARVAAVVRRLRRARFGLVGSPCPGMLDVSVDDALLEQALGVTAVHIELGDLLKAARQASAGEAVGLARELIARVGATEGVSEEIVAENLRLYLGMKQLVEQHRLDAYCIRCWPELRNQLDLTACLTHARMSEDGKVSVCEMDFPALLTAYVLNQLAGAPAFSFDLTGYFEAEGAIQLAHCGAADLSLAADPARTALRRHMRAGTGATLEFAFKGGTITLAKLLLPREARMRLFAARGEVVPTCEKVRGSVATVRPDPSAAAFLEAMLREGVEHHLALVYGDWTGELAQLCEFTGLEMLAP